MLKPAPDSDPATHNRKDRQNHERSQHHHRALMWIAMSAMGSMSVTICLPMVCRSPVVSEERHVPEPEHIKRGDEGRRDANKPIRWIGSVSASENFVFTEEPCQGREAGNRERRR